MTTFIILALLMLVFALLPLVRPLLRARHNATPTPSDANVAIYRQHLDELQQDLDNGLIDRSQYETAETELKQRLLDDTRQANPDATAHFPASRIALGLIIGLPLLASTLYLWLGDPRTLDPGNIRMAGQPSSGANARRELPPIDVMADRLERKLEKKPDLRGWLLLADTRRRLRQYDRAASAYDQALKLKPNDPDILVARTDARAAANGGIIDARGYRDLQRVLKARPRHAQALWLAGNWAYQHKRYRLAIDYWQRLRRLLPADSEDARANLANINAARKKLGLPPARRGAAPTAPASGVITGTITITPRLAARLPKTATLFVLARAVNGPRMPLAVYRMPLRKLPVAFRLDDSMAMRPSLRLSAYRRVIVVARISSSGRAFASPGDLEGRSKVLSLPVSRPVKIIIDRVR